MAGRAMIRLVPARKKRQYVILPGGRSKGTGRGRSAPAPRDADAEARARFSKSRRELIAEAAYYRSLERAPGTGSADQDWLEAEVEIDTLLAQRKG